MELYPLHPNILVSLVLTCIYIFLIFIAFKLFRFDYLQFFCLVWFCLLGLSCAVLRVCARGLAWGLAVLGWSRLNYLGLTTYSFFVWFGFVSWVCPVLFCVCARVDLLGVLPFWGGRARGGLVLVLVLVLRAFVFLFCSTCVNKIVHHKNSLFIHVPKLFITIIGVVGLHFVPS